MSNASYATMSDEIFWPIIELFDWSYEGKDYTKILAPALEALSNHTIQNIKIFHEILSEKLHSLDTEEHARNIGDYSYTGNNNDHFSVDLFLYVRCCVVANGKKLFNSILKNPESMPKNKDFEPLLYLASQAYELRTGKEFDYSAELSCETYSNKLGWEVKPGSMNLPQPFKAMHLIKRQNAGSKIPCDKCGVLVLPTTFNKNAGRCMTCVRIGPPAEKEINSYVQRHPPKMLNSYKSFSNSNLIRTLCKNNKRVVYDRAHIELACNCGSHEHQLKGIHSFDSVREEITIAAPIETICSDCDKKLTLFDPASHGIYAELGAIMRTDIMKRKNIDLQHIYCLSCSANKHQLVVSFSYSYACDSNTDLVSDKFQSIIISSQCVDCKELNLITEYYF